MADGQCVVCAKNLYVYFIEKFPQHEDLAKKRFQEAFGENEAEDLEESLKQQ